MILCTASNLEALPCMLRACDYVRLSVPTDSLHLDRTCVVTYANAMAHIVETQTSQENPQAGKFPLNMAIRTFVWLLSNETRAHTLEPCITADPVKALIACALVPDCTKLRKNALMGLGELVGLGSDTEVRLCLAWCQIYAIQQGSSVSIPRCMSCFALVLCSNTWIQHAKHASISNASKIHSMQITNTDIHSTIQR